MWLLLFSVMLFSAISELMLSFLVMHWSLGPWIGPIFVVVCMTLAAPFISRTWFYEHAIVTVTSASLGGIIGKALGVALPGLYFLTDKDTFAKWLAQPFEFIFSLVVILLLAGLCAFLIAYFIKDYLIVDLALPFPTSKHMYDIISVDHFSAVHKYLLAGMGVATLWNGCMLIVRFLPVTLALQIQTVPFLFSIGFIIGKDLVVPIFWGLINRLFITYGIQQYFFAHVPKQECVILFCLGMLMAYMLHELWVSEMGRNLWSRSWIAMLIQDRRVLSLLLLVIGFGYWLFYVSGMSIYQTALVYFLLAFMGFAVAKVIGQMGSVDLRGFVWCILGALIYTTTIIPQNLLFVSLFATICLGMVIDLIFSYKLAQLAQISYGKVLRYQLVGFLMAIVLSGIFMWFYAHRFFKQAQVLFSADIQDLDLLIKFGALHHVIFAGGLIVGFLLMLYIKEHLLGIVGATLMTPYTSLVLLISGSVSYMLTNSEKYYPLFLGVYAAHALWAVAWVLFIYSY